MLLIRLLLILLTVSGTSLVHFQSAVLFGSSLNQPHILGASLSNRLMLECKLFGQGFTATLAGTNLITPLLQAGFFLTSLKCDDRVKTFSQPPRISNLFFGDSDDFVDCDTFVSRPDSRATIFLRGIIIRECFQYNLNSVSRIFRSLAPRRQFSLLESQSITSILNQSYFSFLGTEKPSLSSEVLPLPIPQCKVTSAASGNYGIISLSPAGPKLNLFCPEEKKSLFITTANPRIVALTALATRVTKRTALTGLDGRPMDDTSLTTATAISNWCSGFVSDDHALVIDSYCSAYDLHVTMLLPMRSCAIHDGSDEATADHRLEVQRSSEDGWIATRLRCKGRDVQVTQSASEIAQRFSSRWIPFWTGLSTVSESETNRPLSGCLGLMPLFGSGLHFDLICASKVYSCRKFKRF